MASCVLVGNIGRIFGGIQVFEGAKADDGRLEIGVVTAKGPVQWSRALARTAVGKAAKSPFVETTSAHKIRIKFDRAVRYELDGGARKNDPAHAHRRRARRHRRLCARRVAGGHVMSTASPSPRRGSSTATMRARP